MKKLIVFLVLLLVSKTFSINAQSFSCATSEIHKSLMAIDPAYAQSYANRSAMIAASPRNHQPEFLKTIPVVVHIVHNNGNENISNERILSQINVLNEDFLKISGSMGDGAGVDTRIQFKLATVDPFGNCTDGITRTISNRTNHIFGFDLDAGTSTNDNLQQIDLWDNSRYLNIWVVNSISYTITNAGVTSTINPAGYSYYPAGAAGRFIDGIVMDYNYFGKGSYSDLASGYELGRTCVQEVAHYLDLIHTFGDGGMTCTDDDGCADTPPCEGVYYDCIAITQCSANRQIENYLDYTPDNCKSIFTSCQMDRMHTALETWRSDLYSYQNLIATGISNFDDDVVINSNTEFNTTNLPNNGEIVMYGNIIIKSGKWLTIGAGVQIAFGPTSNIIIERGARLKLDGATLTSAGVPGTDCGEYLWQGIQVWGTKTIPQPTLNQINYGIQPNHGVLRIYSSTIQDAHEAIRLHRVDDAGNNIMDYTGGVVLAQNSTFRNNRRCVEFLSYEYKNTSTFKDCIFELTEALKIPTSNLASRISMWKVQGVNITKCTFQNTAPLSVFSATERGTGIASIDAQYTVGVAEKYLCNAYMFKNSFIGLYRGIDAQSTGAEPGSNTLQINGNDFTDCYRSVGLFGVNYASVNKNNYQLPDPVGHSVYGIYLGDCNGYKVQENILTGNATAGSGVAIRGIISQRSGNDPNLLYKNTFTNVIVGNQIQNNNLGLDIDCSKFYNGEMDIVINSSGVLGDQGRCEPLVSSPDFYTAPIANTFSASCDNSIFWHILTDAAAPPPDFNYNSNAGAEPICYDNNVITVERCKAQFDEEKSCPSLLSGCHNPGDIWGKIANFGGTIAILKKKIDGGDKPGLVIFILDKKNTPQTVKGKLTGIGPYLSDEVLEAAINRANPLPSDILKEILLLNSPLTTPVMKAVEDRVPPLSVKDMKELKAAQQDESERSKLEREIRYYESQRQLQINELTRQYLMSEQPDSIIAFLENENTIRAKKDLIELYMRKGNTQMAEYHLADIPSTDMESENFVKMQTVALELKKQNKTYHELSRQQEMTIRDVASMNSTQEFRARNILLQVFNEKFEEPIEELPQGIAFAKSAGKDTSDIFKNDSVILIPPIVCCFCPGLVYNPVPIQNTQEHVSIPFNANHIDQPLFLVISDILGKTLQSSRIENNGEAVIITDDLKNGIYFYRIITSHSIVQSGKLVIVR